MAIYKVYLADDERHIREGIAESIPWEEYRFRFEGTGADGRRAYEDIVSLRPDIVITDIKMPRMDGLELIRRIQLEISDIRFIVLSGYGEFELAAQAMKYGVKHFLLKPSNEEEIVAVLKEVASELDERIEREQELLEMKRQMDWSRQARLSIEAFYETNGIGRAEGTNPTDSERQQEQVEIWSRRMIEALRGGDEEALSGAIEGYNGYLFESRFEVSVTLSHTIELLKLVFKGTIADTGPDWMKSAAKLWQAKSLREVRQFLQGELRELMDEKEGKLPPDKKAMQVARMKQLTVEHLVDEKLSLQWLAQQHLFLHPEYLGKLFRQVTGMKFSQYVTGLRLERAKELILIKPEIRMYEIAERSGFGMDPQYFSNVFKKATGMSPLEYRRSNRDLRDL